MKTLLFSVALMITTSVFAAPVPKCPAGVVPAIIAAGTPLADAAVLGLAPQVGACNRLPVGPDDLRDMAVSYDCPATANTVEVLLKTVACDPATTSILAIDVSPVKP